MYRSFYCKKCKASSTQKINAYMIAWGADNYICCDKDGYYVKLIGSHGHGKPYESNHPKHSL